MKILEDHSLEGVKKVPITPNSFYNGGREMPIRRLAIIHYTEGLTAMSSINFWRSQKCLKDDIGAHFIIDRDGEILQTRACNRTISHAGKSKWVDPKTGKSYSFLNSCSIGIELANAGSAVDRLGEEKLQFYSGQCSMKHRNENVIRNWENYTKQQIDSVIKLLGALLDRYKLDDITGHDCVSPDRKTDPGPSFPMLTVRERFGFKGLPQVHF